MTPVVNVTWSFRNHPNILICCSGNFSYCYQCWKHLCCLIFFGAYLISPCKSSINVFKTIGQIHFGTNSYPTARWALTFCSGVTLDTYFLASYLLWCLMHTTTNGCNKKKERKRLEKLHHNSSNNNSDNQDTSYQISNRRLFAFGKFLQLFPVLLLSQSF